MHGSYTCDSLSLLSRSLLAVSLSSSTLLSSRLFFRLSATPIQYPLSLFSFFYITFLVLSFILSAFAYNPSRSLWRAPSLSCPLDCNPTMITCMTHCIRVLRPSQDQLTSIYQVHFDERNFELRSNPSTPVKKGFPFSAKGPQLELRFLLFSPPKNAEIALLPRIWPQYGILEPKNFLVNRGMALLPY